MFFEYEKEKPSLLENIKDLNGNLHIPKGLWRDTIDFYKKEEVLRKLKELINNNEIKFPFREYSFLEIQEEYQRYPDIYFLTSSFNSEHINSIKTQHDNYYNQA